MNQSNATSLAPLDEPGRTEPAAGGCVIHPTDPAYAQTVAGWNVLAQHHPAAAVRAQTTDDVVTAVRHARQAGLGVAAMTTGHGLPTVGTDALLVNTSAIRGVHIDAERRTATVGAGATWRDVHEQSAPHGLVGVCGSSAQVGVVGYTQGGGFGWLSRNLGYAASWVRAAELVTADGELVRASADEHPDLLWAVAGGGGNVGVVTSLTFELHRLERVYGGNLYYPLEHAREVIGCYAAWAPGLPVEFMSALTFRTFPDAPFVPEGLRGRAFVAIRGCYSGDDLECGRTLVDAARAGLGEPVADTFGVLPATDLDSISMDPKIPVRAVQHAGALADIDDRVVDALVAAAGADSGSPFAMLELRQLGGALNDALVGPHPMAATNAAYTINAIGLAPTPEREQFVRDRQQRLFDRLCPALTGTTYLNFLDGDRPDAAARVRAAYTGADWERLTDIKTTYDPTNVFRWNRNIPPRGLAATTTTANRNVTTTSTTNGASS